MFNFLKPIILGVFVFGLACGISYILHGEVIKEAVNNILIGFLVFFTSDISIRLHRLGG